MAKREVPSDLVDALMALTPANVCNLAYSMYVCTAEEEKGKVTSIGRTAREAVKVFEALEKWVERRGGPREKKFLFLIRLSAVSLCRGLFRRKQEQHVRTEAAIEERARSIKQAQLSTSRGVFLTTAWKAAMTGGVGFLFAKTFAPDFLSESGHGPTVFSMGVGFASLLAYYYFRSFYLQRVDRRIYTLYEMAERFAVEENEVGSRGEYIRARREVTEAWKGYFGHAPKGNTLDFGHVLEDNIERRRDHERQIQRVRMGEWYYFVTFVSATYREARKLRKTATKATNGWLQKRHRKQEALKVAKAKRIEK